VGSLRTYLFGDILRSSQQNPYLVQVSPAHGQRLPGGFVCLEGLERRHFCEVANWLDHVKTKSDVGAKLFAALFNKETDFIRQQIAKAPELAPARTIMLHSCPT
jgi:hypothetical protein